LELLQNSEVLKINLEVTLKTFKTFLDLVYNINMKNKKKTQDDGYSVLANFILTGKLTPEQKSELDKYERETSSKPKKPEK
jgi:hypothetical protein